ncbi:hypothetical protein GCM10009347_06170 [Shewanella algicola]|nr:hypothetical protein GCM10009347_06170 [Shewanella algicola]
MYFWWSIEIQCAAIIENAQLIELAVFESSQTECVWVYNLGTSVFILWRAHVYRTSTLGWIIKKA